MAKRRLRPLYVVAALCWCGLVYVLVGLFGYFDLGIYWPHTYSMESSSNAPTILKGDYVLAWQHYYRFNEPVRGEMVVFKLPTDSRIYYIQRLVGLPGDRVRMMGGILHINGMPVKREKSTPAEGTDKSDGEESFTAYIETLPNGTRYPVQEESDEQIYDNTPEHTVPPGHYFFLGDNRDHSRDSRAMHAVGFVPRENLRDHPAFIFWSDDWERIGTRVQPLP